MDMVACAAGQESRRFSWRLPTPTVSRIVTSHPLSFLVFTPAPAQLALPAVCSVTSSLAAAPGRYPPPRALVKTPTPPHHPP